MNDQGWTRITWKPLSGTHHRIGAVTPVHLLRPGQHNLMGDIYTACGRLVPSDLVALRNWNPDPATHVPCPRCQAAAKKG